VGNCVKLYRGFNTISWCYFLHAFKRFIVKSYSSALSSILLTATCTHSAIKHFRLLQVTIIIIFPLSVNYHCISIDVTKQYSRQSFLNCRWVCSVFWFTWWLYYLRTMTPGCLNYDVSLSMTCSFIWWWWLPSGNLLYCSCFIVLLCSVLFLYFARDIYFQGNCTVCSVFTVHCIHTVLVIHCMLVFSVSIDDKSAYILL